MSYATQAAGSPCRHTLTNAAAFFMVLVFTLCSGLPGSQADAAAATASAPKEASPRSSNASPELAPVSSIMPANRFGLIGDGSGLVSDEFYSCVARDYGGKFKGRMANLQRAGRAPTYEVLLKVTRDILQEVQFCADQEKGAKINLRRLIQALEAK